MVLLFTRRQDGQLLTHAHCRSLCVFHSASLPPVGECSSRSRPSSLAIGPSGPALYVWYCAHCGVGDAAIGLASGLLMPWPPTHDIHAKYNAEVEISRVDASSLITEVGVGVGLFGSANGSSRRWGGGAALGSMIVGSSLCKRSTGGGVSAGSLNGSEIARSSTCSIP